VPDLAYDIDEEIHERGTWNAPRLERGHRKVEIADQNTNPRARRLHKRDRLARSRKLGVVVVGRGGRGGRGAFRSGRFLRRPFLDDGGEGFGLDGFGHMVIHSSLKAGIPVRLHGARGQSNDRNVGTEHFGIPASIFEKSKISLMIAMSEPALLSAV